MAGMAILMAAAASAASATEVMEATGVLPPPTPEEKEDRKYGTLCPKNPEHGRSWAKYCPVCKARLWRK